MPVLLLLISWLTFLVMCVIDCLAMPTRSLGTCYSIELAETSEISRNTASHFIKRLWHYYYYYYYLYNRQYWSPLYLSPVCFLDFCLHWVSYPVGAETLLFFLYSSWDRLLSSGFSLYWAGMFSEFLIILWKGAAELKPGKELIWGEFVYS